MVGRRCGCGGVCSCVFEAGRGASLTGTDPILVEIADGQAFIRGAATDTVAVTVTGTGTVEDPYVVTMTEFAGGRQPIVFEFATAGVYTWTKPTFGTLMRAYILSAGGGGAGAGSAGPKPELWSAAQYAWGGNPGGDLIVDAVLADMPATLAVTVGAGGSGGARSTSGVVAQTPGHPGVAGGGSSLGQWSVMASSGGVTLAQGASDARPAAIIGQGGAGGLFMGGGPETPREGKRGAGGYLGQPPVGGYGGVATGLADTAGGPSPLRFRPRGTGGGGGYGSLNSFDGGNVSGATGGAGGPGAGGGGGGIGSTYGGAGGRGGDGLVRILIQ